MSGRPKVKLVLLYVGEPVAFKYRLPGRVPIPRAEIPDMNLWLSNRNYMNKWCQEHGGRAIDKPDWRGQLAFEIEEDEFSIFDRIGQEAETQTKLTEALGALEAKHERI